MSTTADVGCAGRRLPEGWAIRRITLARSSEHAVLVALAAAREALTAVVTAPVLSLTARESAAALVAAHDLATQVASVRLRIVGHADSVDVAELDGSVSTTAQLAAATRTTRRAAQRDVTLAQALDRRWIAVRDALASSAINLEQASEIVRALDALPDDVEGLDERVRRLAEIELIALAGQHDAADLRVLGRWILDVVAPQVGEAREAKLLAAQEAAAEKKKRFTMTDDGHGSVHGRFTIPTAVGDMLRTHLMALSSRATPRRTGPGPPPTPDPPSRPARLPRGRRPDRRPSAWARRSSTTSSATPPTTPPTPGVWPRSSW